MVFVFVVTELTATLLLAPIGTRTLAIEVWANTSSLAFAAAAPFAAMMLLISLVSTWLLAAPFRRRRISRSGLTMADVRIAGLTKSFRGAPILRGVDLGRAVRRAVCDSGRIGQRQDDAFEIAQRF